MSDVTDHVIIVGASTRAAATSARRAGWKPWCADLFADADLQRIATVRKVPLDGYPHGLLDALKDAPAWPVIYTGALENWPTLIAKIDQPLWGNPPEVLRAVRSPERWTKCLAAHRISCPALSSEPTTAGRWLLKPRKSAGGFGIQTYHGQAFNPRTHFLQQWIDGVPRSAVFLGDGERALLVGVTQQLIGSGWLNATGFHYAGSVGPVPLDDASTRRWRALGSALAETFHLRGLFGVDAIWRGGVPWPIEINPRYTASVEILERRFRVPLLRCHGDVFHASALSAIESSAPSLFWGKGILFARATLAFPPRGPWNAALEAGADLDAVEYADIPHPGEIIERGRPVLTLFASAATFADCEMKLQEKARTLDRRLWG